MHYIENMCTLPPHILLYSQDPPAYTYTPLCA